MKFVKTKKIVCILLIICFSISLTYCSDKPTVVNNNQTSSENGENSELSSDIPEQETDILEYLPQKDWNGKEFRILSRACCESHVQEVWVESETGDVIDDAVYKRNRAVEERFNITIVPTFIDASTSEDFVNKTFENSVLAGDDAWDFAKFHEMFGSWSVMKGTALNWYSLPYVEFTNPWWASWIMDDYTIAGKTYLALNDMGTGSITEAMCLYFNKNLVQQYGLENPYELVRDGKWTLDKLAEYIKGASKDLDGNGIKDENDLYGIAGSAGHSFTFMYASDQTVTKRNSEGYPEIVLYCEKMINIFNKYKDILQSGDSAIGDKYDWTNIFKAGHALIALGSINDALVGLRDMTSDFGIIPYPKYNEEQKDYFTHITAHGGIMVVPMTISDPEFVGMIIEALAAEGYAVVKPAVLDVALKTKQVRDEDSAEMVDIILKGRRSDFGYPYDGWGMTFALDFLARGEINDFASYYEKNVKRAEKAYASVIESFNNFDY